MPGYDQLFPRVGQTATQARGGIDLNVIEILFTDAKVSTWIGAGRDFLPLSNFLPAPIDQRIDKSITCFLEFGGPRHR